VPAPTRPVVIAVDPGRQKCGIAVVDAEGRVLERGVVPTAQMPERVKAWAEQYGAEHLILGDRTTAREALEALLAAGLALQPIPVDEHQSTEAARKRYFLENPPRGWRRLIPTSLQVPPVPYDDYVAVILAERFLDALRR